MLYFHEIVKYIAVTSSEWFNGLSWFKKTSPLDTCRPSAFCFMFLASLHIWGREERDERWDIFSFWTDKHMSPLPVHAFNISWGGGCQKLNLHFGKQIFHSYYWNVNWLQKVCIEVIISYEILPFKFSMARNKHSGINITKEEIVSMGWNQLPDALSYIYQLYLCLDHFTDFIFT